MDHFFIEIYESVIYQWIVLNQNDYLKKGIHFHIDENDSNRLLFDNQGLRGEIYFWKKHHIIEETIYDENQEIIFYLHFKIVNLAVVKKMVQDFLSQMGSRKIVKYIGMSCSCGITSSLFVEKIQELSQQLGLPYLFKVIPLNDIQNVYKDYDLLILAPQTAYLEPKVKAICQNHCCVVSMDASIFATGRYQQALAIIQEKLG